MTKPINKTRVVQQLVHPFLRSQFDNFPIFSLKLLADQHDKVCPVV